MENTKYIVLQLAFISYQFILPVNAKYSTWLKPTFIKHLLAQKLKIGVAECCVGKSGKEALLTVVLASLSMLKQFSSDPELACSIKQNNIQSLCGPTLLREHLFDPQVSLVWGPIFPYECLSIFLQLHKNLIWEEFWWIQCSVTCNASIDTSDGCLGVLPHNIALNSLWTRGWGMPQYVKTWHNI